MRRRNARSVYHFAPRLPGRDGRCSWGYTIRPIKSDKWQVAVMWQVRHHVASLHDMCSAVHAQVAA